MKKRHRVGGWLLRKGTLVHTHDAGAARWGRPVEKPEGKGRVIDHFRDISGAKSPPYFVQLESGERAWYDADEVD